MAKKPEKIDKPDDQKADVEAQSLPAKIKMLEPHGFIDDETGKSYFWQQGQTVFEPAEIAMLVERKASFEPVSDA
ncbi:MAG: hypothetical protein ABL901_02925 [Hyphomicrobiaceae bacterium]|nr:hypothetical protein [Hyphomicrobiaceae bacterium]